MSRSTSYFPLLAGFAMLLLSLLGVPTLNDDMVYRFVWNADVDAPIQTIDGVGDLLRSQWIHYQTLNGRLVVHLLAQTFLVFVPPVVLQVVNAVLFALLLCWCACWVNRPAHRLPVMVGACFLLFVVFRGFRTAMLWSLGTFNYLWVLVATLGLLLWLRRVRAESWRPLHGVLAPLALLVGWGHEALSLPLSVAFAAFLLVNGKRVWRSPVAVYLLCYMAGTALCLLSPGIWARADQSLSLSARLLGGVTNYLINVRVAWLLLLALLFTARCRRALLKAHLREHAYAYVALVASMGVVFLCGTTLERVAFFTDFMAMLLLLPLLADVLPARWERRLVAACCGVMLLWFVPAYMVGRENRNNWLDAERQMREPGRELIAVECPEPGRNWLMDCFRGRYANTSVEFGFYCCYMAFDATDNNTRCVARLYGKPRLTFLPADMVRRMERDSTAYRQAELSRDGQLYAWQLDDDHRAGRLTFVLNAEDTSALLPHQRLLAYHGDSYQLDDFHQEVVHVAGRSYLVFTRPTTNIYRRIDHIEISGE